MSDVNPYPQYPGRPLDPEVGPGPAPASVLNAVKLMFARAALSALGLVVTLLTVGTIRDRIRTTQTSLSPTQVDTAVSVAVGVGVVFGIIFIALYVLLALQVRKGRSWARIVTIVLASLGVLGGLFSLVQPGAGISRVLALVQLVVDAAIIVLLAQRASGAYFAPRR